MWSKKTKENEEKNTNRTFTTHHHAQTSQTLSVQTTEYRTRSISYAGNGAEFLPLDSLTKLDGKNFSVSPKPVLKSSSIASLGNKVSVDAKPISPINLNYQSPYRNSPVYSSFNAPKPVKNIASYSKPSPAIVVSKTPPSTLFSTARIIVKKTGKIYDGNCTIPTYQTHSKNRGEVLIVNNIMFSDKGYRHGAEVDDKKLKDVFSQIGFSVTVKRDLKKSDMVSKIKDFSKKGSLKTSDIAIVIVMSHGTKNEALGGTEVFGIDEKGIPVEELLEPFNESNCKNMIGKPKIFIFQCCRGDNEQFVQSDAVRSLPALADSLIAYSTLPGFLSHRDPEHGTWYISALCDVFSKHAHEYTVEDLLKMVDMELSKWHKNVRQTTHYENRGFKRCFLHPK